MVAAAVRDWAAANPHIGITRGTGLIDRSFTMAADTDRITSPWRSVLSLHATPYGTGPMLEILELMIACRRQPPSLRDLCPQLPWSLNALAAKCIAFDPARRYARAADLAEDLRRFLDDLPMKYCPEPSVRERMGKFARRHPGLCGSTSIAILAILLVGLLGGAVTLVYDKMQDLSARVRYRVFDHDFTEIQWITTREGTGHFPI